MDFSSSLSPMPTRNVPEITVTYSAVECQDPEQVLLHASSLESKERVASVGRDCTHAGDRGQRKSGGTMPPLLPAGRLRYSLTLRPAPIPSLHRSRTTVSRLSGER